MFRLLRIEKDGSRIPIDGVFTDAREVLDYAVANLDNWRQYLVDEDVDPITMDSLVDLSQFAHERAPVDMLLISVGDTVRFRLNGKTYDGRVVSIHPEPGRRYIVVHRFKMTATGKYSSARSNDVCLSIGYAIRLKSIDSH